MLHNNMQEIEKVEFTLKWGPVSCPNVSGLIWLWETHTI